MKKYFYFHEVTYKNYPIVWEEQGDEAVACFILKNNLLQRIKELNQENFISVVPIKMKNDKYVITELDNVIAKYKLAKNYYYTGANLNKIGFRGAIFFDDEKNAPTKTPPCSTRSSIIPSDEQKKIDAFRDREISMDALNNYFLHSFSLQEMLIKAGESGSTIAYLSLFARNKCELEQQRKIPLLFTSQLSAIKHQIRSIEIVRLKKARIEILIDLIDNVLGKVVQKYPLFQESYQEYTNKILHAVMQVCVSEVKESKPAQIEALALKLAYDQLDVFFKKGLEEQQLVATYHLKYKLLCENIVEKEQLVALNLKDKEKFSTEVTRDDYQDGEYIALELVLNKILGSISSISYTSPRRPSLYSKSPATTREPDLKQLFRDKMKEALVEYYASESQTDAHHLKTLLSNHKAIVPLIRLQLSDNEKMFMHPEHEDFLKTAIFEQFNLNSSEGVKNLEKNLKTAKPLLTKIIEQLMDKVFHSDKQLTNMM